MFLNLEITRTINSDLDLQKEKESVIPLFWVSIYSCARLSNRFAVVSLRFGFGPLVYEGDGSVVDLCCSVLWCGVGVPPWSSSNRDCVAFVWDYVVVLRCTIYFGVMNGLVVCTGVNLSRGSDVLNEFWLCKIVVEFSNFSVLFYMCRYSFYSEGLGF